MIEGSDVGCKEVEEVVGGSVEVVKVVGSDVG